MSGCLMVGGAYFSDERVEFFDRPHDLNLIPAGWEDVFNVRTGVLPQDLDWVFIFGIKRWVRKLGKQRLTPERIADRIMIFLHRNIPVKCNVGILDDCNLQDELRVGEILRGRFEGEFRCKVVLLREYLEGKQYSKVTTPFSICCPSYKDFRRTVPKQINLYFYGNRSHKERKEYVKKFKTLGVESSILKAYTHGESSPDKVKREVFLHELAGAKIGLSFQGAGYCCFRHQEIPSVGTVLAMPKYPWVMRNPYEHDKSCVVFNRPKEVLKYLRDAGRLEEMRQAGVAHFEKYHTTEVRFNEFMGYLDEVRRH